MPIDPAADSAEIELQTPRVLVGQLLQDERLRQSLSEKEVADRLHITMHYVRALEANRFDKLPGAVFAKGYIKSYALLLGLDETVAIERYLEDVTAEREGQQKQKAAEPRRRSMLLPGTAVLVGLTAVSAVALWGYDSGEAERGQQSIPNSQSNLDQAVQAQPARTRDAVTQQSQENQPVSADAMPAVAAAVVNPLQTEVAADPLSVELPSPQSDPDLMLPEDNAVMLVATVKADAANSAAMQTSVETTEQTGASAETIIEVVSEGADVLQIRFLGESWVEVNDGSEQQIYRDLRGAGDVLEITGTAPFNILLGDAPYTRLSLNGAEIDVSSDIRIDNSARLTVGL